MYKTQFSSRPNSPSAQTWYHSSPLRAIPNDGTVSSLPKKNYQATSSFLMWAPNPEWKVMIQEEEKLEKRPTGVDSWGGGPLAFRKAGGSLFGRPHHGAQAAQVPPHRQKTRFKFKLTSSHLWESFVDGYLCSFVTHTHQYCSHFPFPLR